MEAHRSWRLERFHRMSGQNKSLMIIIICQEQLGAVHWDVCDFLFFCTLGSGARRLLIGWLEDFSCSEWVSCSKSWGDWQGVKSVCWCGTSPRSQITSNSLCGNYSNFMQHKVKPWEDRALLSTVVDVLILRHYLVYFSGNWGNPPLIQGNSENTSCWQKGPCTLHLYHAQTPPPPPPPPTSTHLMNKGATQKRQWKQWKQCLCVNVDGHIHTSWAVHTNATHCDADLMKNAFCSFSFFKTYRTQTRQHIHTHTITFTHTFIHRHTHLFLLWHIRMPVDIQSHKHTRYDKDINPRFRHAHVNTHTHTHSHTYT